MQPEIAKQVDNAFILIVAVSVFFLLLVTVFMIYFVIRYRKKKHPISENITGNTTLEILWTIIPLALVLVIFFYSWSGFKLMREVPSDAMTVKVTASMWRWAFEYPNGKKSDTLLYIPVGKNIKLELTSTDVNHSFYIPYFRTKEDVVPGRTNYMWFQATEAGSYDIMCAEYCGLNHSYMLGKIIAMPESEYNVWLNTKPPENKIDSLKTDSTKKIQDTIKVKTDSLKTVKDTVKTKK